MILFHFYYISNAVNQTQKNPNISLERIPGSPSVCMEVKREYLQQFLGIHFAFMMISSVNLIMIFDCQSNYSIGHFNSLINQIIFVLASVEPTKQPHKHFKNTV